MTNQLTSNELIDILLQKPGRVTEGLLEKRNPLQKMRDHLLAHKQTEMVEYGRTMIKGKIQRFRRDHFHVFNEAAKIDQPHPRSLANAVRELRYIGFDGEQIEAIKKMVYRVTLTGLFYDTELRDKVSQHLGGTVCYFWNDDAFVGAGIYVIEGEIERGGLVSGEADGLTALNSAYQNDEMMAYAEECFTRDLKFQIEHLMEPHIVEKPGEEPYAVPPKVDLLKPAAAHKMHRIARKKATAQPS